MEASFMIVLLGFFPFGIILGFDKNGTGRPCLECHSSKIPGVRPITWDARYIHRPVRLSQCTLCHKENERALINEAAACLACHRAELFKGKAYRHPGTEENYCLSCHEAHSSEHEFLLKDDPVSFCQSCHSGMSSHRSHPIGGKIQDPLRGRTMTCTSTCHTVHLSDYSDLTPCPSRELCLKCHANSFK